MPVLEHPAGREPERILLVADIPLDPRFANNEAVRANYAALHAEIERTLASRSALEWEEIMADALAVVLGPVD